MTMFMALLVEALGYKQEDGGFYSRSGHWVFLNLPNPSRSTMALEFTQPLTEMSTRKIPGSKARPVRKADLISISTPIV
jgi:hypothetical protein